jgi:hypothetical protein
VVDDLPLNPSKDEPVYDYLLLMRHGRRQTGGKEPASKAEDRAEAPETPHGLTQTLSQPHRRDRGTPLPLPGGNSLALVACTARFRRTADPAIVDNSGGSMVPFVAVTLVPTSPWSRRRGPSGSPTTRRTGGNRS